MKTSQKVMPCGNLESLLKFTTVASAYIHSVLKKPVKSRRKVNHRKFLQKQLGAYSQYKSVFINNADETQDSDKYFYHFDPSAVQESEEAKSKCLDSATDGAAKQSLEKLFDPDVWKSKTIGRESKLRDRQLPESFWKEPQIYKSSNTSLLLRSDRAHSSQNEIVETFDFLGVEFDELLEKLSDPDDSDVLSTSSSPCTSLSDSCSVGCIEPETSSSINSDSPDTCNLSRSVYDQIWNVPPDIVNLTRSSERYFF